VSQTRQASRSRPNVLLITTDQERYDTLGATGNAIVRTPNLDALAQRGTVFTRGYIQNPVCMPSRACIMTGRYVHQHGVDHMESVIATSPGLPPWETTVQERLQREGYATAAYGKIHQLPPRGWDETALTMGKGARWTVAGRWRPGLEGAEESPLGPSQLGPVYAEWLEAKRPGAYESIYAQRRLPEYRDQANAIVNTLAADEYVDYWIGQNTWQYLEREETGREERPFFLWCGFCGPHGPWDPPEPYASMYPIDEMPVSPLLHARQNNVPGEDRKSRYDREDGEALARKVTAYYYGMMTCIDNMVGRITEVLTRRGLWENTLVIFTTDHGEMLGDFGRNGKGNFTEAVIRAPYIVVPPGSTPAGEPQHFDGLVEHVDLVPTILDYAGQPRPGEVVGTSLRPALEGRGSEVPAKESVLCEYVNNDSTLRQKCLRTERYKYVFNGADRPVELYDLAEDPQELVNVAGEARYRDQVERHAKLLLDRLSTSEQTLWNSGGFARAKLELDGFGRPGA